MIFPNNSESYIFLTIGIVTGFYVASAFLRRVSRRYTRFTLLKLIRNMASGEDVPPQLQNLADLASQQELKMVFVVRTDLKMGVGKIGAQCGHAAIACYEMTAETAPHFLIAWREQGQTKITLKADSEEQLDTLQKNAETLGLVAEVIHDAGRTQIPTGTKTVLGIGPAPKGIVDQVTGHLKLLN